MILKKLKFKNIRSYEDFEIDFSEGSTLLAGDIGSGKTSILLALQFALFGLQPGQKGSSILRQGSDGAIVSLNLEVDGKNIILERTIKRSKSSISQDSNVLVIDGERQEISTSEMKTRVIELLNYPKEFVKKSNLLYKFTVYTPQEEMKEIISERPEIRLDTLRHIFGIDRYKRIKDNSQLFLQRIKEAVKIKEVEINQLNELKEKQTFETEKKIKLTKQVNDFSIEKNELVKDKDIAEEKLKQTQELIEQKNKLNSETIQKETELKGKQEINLRLAKDMASMNLQIKDKINFSPEMLNNIIGLLLKHKQNLDELNSKYIDTNSNISVFNDKKETSFKLKEKILSLDNCPTCVQPVKQEHKDKISQRTQYDIEDFNRELERMTQIKEQLLKDLEKERNLVSGYEADKSELESNKIKFEHQQIIETKIKSDAIILERNMGEIKQLEIGLSELKNKLQEFLQIQEKFEIDKKLFDKINQQLQNLNVSLAEKNKELELLKIILEGLQKDIFKKEQIRKELSHIRGLQDWLEDKFLPMITLTEANVLATLRQNFSKTFNEWFSILVSDVLTARLDEDFTPIISQQDYEIDYDFLSGGERTAVALAYRLALNQVLNSLLSKIKTKDVIILDEPTDGFSEQQLDKMRDIFEQLEYKQMILVSHEQKIEGFVDRVVRIKKEGNSFAESD